jgi:3-isopropylmalate dehydratase small subunit
MLCNDIDLSPIKNHEDVALKRKDYGYCKLLYGRRNFGCRSSKRQMILLLNIQAFELSVINEGEGYYERTNA